MLLIVGRIGRPAGLAGELTIEVRTDDPQARFTPGSILGTEPADRGPLTVAAARTHAGRLVLAFEGVGDREGADALRGTLLVLDSASLPPPANPDEFYDHQLTGLRVCTVEGEDLGAIAEVLHLPGGDVLAVRRQDAPELLVPFVAAMVPEVDLAGGRVVIDPPPGLLDLADGRPRPTEPNS